MLFLMPNQQCQSTEGTVYKQVSKYNFKRAQWTAEVESGVPEERCQD